jgi:hypothetical protein
MKKTLEGMKRVCVENEFEREKFGHFCRMKLRGGE